MRVLRQDDPEFPREVLTVKDPPRVLYAQGDLGLLKRRRVAIIGSRKPSPYGVTMAWASAKALAESGVVIVSGMAMGLDARAHRGALDAGGGTIAVLGSGIDVNYPRVNSDLLNEVRSKGLVLSEFPPGYPSHKWNFPARNRIIVALAECLLVVEGHIKGGTSNTVRWASDRTAIFAVPGRIGDDVASGPNLLLQQGAHVYLQPNDVLQYLELPLRPDEDDERARALRERRELAEQARSCLTGAEATLFDLISPSPVHVDVLATRSRVEPGLLLAALSSLELRGLVTQLPGKHFALAS